MKGSDYYDVLGLTRDATAEDVKRAYRKLARQTHPDAGGSAALFRLVNEAWDVLGNDGSRATYDHDRRTGSGAGHQSSRGANGNSRRANGHDAGEAWERPGTKQSRATRYGRPGDAADTAAKFGAYAAVGARGERALAYAIDRANLPDDAFVFHDLSVGDRGGNIDHVVVYGDQALVIDMKMWAPGRYETHGGWAYRNGARFEPGDLDGTLYLMGRLATALGVRGRMCRVIVVAPSSGHVDSLELSAYHPHDFHVRRIEDVERLVDGWVRKVRADHTGNVPAPSMSVLYALLNMTVRAGEWDASTAAPADPSGVAGVDPNAGGTGPRWGSGRVVAAAGAALACLAALTLWFLFAQPSLGTSPYDADVAYAVTAAVPAALMLGASLAGWVWSRRHNASEDALTAVGRRTGPTGPDTLVRIAVDLARPFAPVVAVAGIPLVGAARHILAAFPLWGEQLAHPAAVAAGCLYAVAGAIAIASVSHLFRPAMRPGAHADWFEALSAAHASPWHAPLFANVVRAHSSRSEVRDLLAALTAAGGHHARFAEQFRVIR